MILNLRVSVSILRPVQAHRNISLLSEQRIVIKRRINRTSPLRRLIMTLRQLILISLTKANTMIILYKIIIKRTRITTKLKIIKTRRIKRLSKLQRIRIKRVRISRVSIQIRIIKEKTKERTGLKIKAIRIIRLVQNKVIIREIKVKYILK